jgi:hypothetical protein
VSQIEAIDWSGQVRGGLVLPGSMYALGTVIPSPDGQRLLIEHNSAYSVLSAQGQVVASFPGSNTREWVGWSDDDAHVCAVRNTGDTAADLLLMTAGGPTRKVTSIHWPRGNGGPSAEVCSVANDVAVLSVSLGDDAAGHVVEIKVVRLSTGAVLRDLHPPAPDFSGPEPRPAPGALVDVTGSPDGRLLALRPYTAMDATTANTSIVDTVSGRTVGHVNALVFGFTGDDSAVLSYAGRIDWKTGRTTGRVAGCCGPALAVRHGSADVVVSVDSGPQPTPDARSVWPAAPPQDVMLLRTDGTTLRLACCGATILTG